MILYAYWEHFSNFTYYPIAEQIAKDIPWFHKHGLNAMSNEVHPHWENRLKEDIASLEKLVVEIEGE